MSDTPCVGHANAQPTHMETKMPVLSGGARGLRRVCARVSHVPHRSPDRVQMVAGFSPGRRKRAGGKVAPPAPPRPPNAPALAGAHRPGAPPFPALGSEKIAHRFAADASACPRPLAQFDRAGLATVASEPTPPTPTARADSPLVGLSPCASRQR